MKRMVWPFWLQVCDLLLIPFIVWWSFTPAAVFSQSGLNTLECAFAMILTSIPFGIIGLAKARKMSRLRVAASVLSVVNLCTGVLILALLVLVFYVAAIGA